MIVSSAVVHLRRRAIVSADSLRLRESHQGIVGSRLIFIPERCTLRHPVESQTFHRIDAGVVYYERALRKNCCGAAFAVHCRYRRSPGEIEPWISGGVNPEVRFTGE